MFTIAIDEIKGGGLQYTWTLYSPAKTPIAYGNIFDSMEEVVQQANLFIKHFNGESQCTLMEPSIPQIPPVRSKKSGHLRLVVDNEN